MSARASTFFDDAICSGDMYAGEPMISPVFVALPPTRRLRDAEVEHLDERRAVVAGRDEQVAGLEIAMDDAVRVRLGEGLERLQDVVDRVAERERRRAAGSAGRSPRPPAAPSRCTARRCRACRRRARGRCARCAAGPPPSPRARSGPTPAPLASASGQHELDRDALVELEVGRRHDHAHAADAEDPVDLVLARERVTDVDERRHPSRVTRRPFTDPNCSVLYQPGSTAVSSPRVIAALSASQSFVT